MSEKKCPRCGESDQAEFYPSKLAASGSSVLCKECSRTVTAAWRLTPAGRESTRAASARWLAKSEANRRRGAERSRRWRERQKQESSGEHCTNNP